MKSKNLILFILVVVGILLVITFFRIKSKDTSSGSTSDNNSTASNVMNKNQNGARNAYSLALDSARQYSTDSYLVDINTTGVDSNGLSKTWYVYFYSPSKDKNFKVYVVEGKVDRTEEKSASKKEQLSDKWVDSVVIAKEAVETCDEQGKMNPPDYFISLNPGKDDEPDFWSYNCLVGENKTLKVYFNASTGEFMDTGRAGIGW
jgi:hypothetical protein